MSTTEMALIPLQDYANICVSLRAGLGLDETRKITSGEAYGMTLQAIIENREKEDLLIAGGDRDEYINDRVVKIREYAFYTINGLKVVKFPVARTVGTYAFANNTDLEQAHFPVATTVGGNVFNGCSALQIADIGFITPLNPRTFYNASALCTVILRRTVGVASLSSIAVFAGTPFAEGGTGGKVYVPEALVESYKTATNWSVLYGYGTCDFVALEGSEYE